jgi:hypothetical protein
MGDCDCQTASWMPLVGVVIGGFFAALFWWLFTQSQAPAPLALSQGFNIVRDATGRIVSVQG